MEIQIGQPRAAARQPSPTSASSAAGVQCNFYIYYKVDDEEVPTALRLDEYEDEAEYGWVLVAPRRPRRPLQVRARVRRVRSTTRWRWTRPRRCTFLQGWG